MDEKRDGTIQAALASEATNDETGGQFSDDYPSDFTP